jgi:hypothetical protein
MIAMRSINARWPTTILSFKAQVVIALTKSPGGQGGAAADRQNTETIDVRDRLPQCANKEKCKWHRTDDRQGKVTIAVVPLGASDRAVVNRSAPRSRQVAVDVKVTADSLRPD